LILICQLLGAESILKAIEYKLGIKVRETTSRKRKKGIIMSKENIGQILEDKFY
jgi:hypothetical protein